MQSGRKGAGTRRRALTGKLSRKPFAYVTDIGNHL